MYGDPEVLKQLCDHATVALDAAGAAICLVDDSDRITFAAASDNPAARLGRAEVARSEGPTVEACRSGRVVVVDDVAVSAWPHLRRVARELGVSSIAAMPIALDGDAIGALEVYRERPGCWSRHDLGVGHTVTEIATVLMSRTSDLDRAEAMVDQLRDTLENRAVIEQAKGMIARDHHVSVEVAFETLRRHSRNTNTPVRVLARAVTELGAQIPPAGLPRGRQSAARSSVPPGTFDFVVERS